MNMNDTTIKFFAPAASIFACVSLTTPTFAEDFSHLNLNPNFTVHIVKHGAVITPSSSIPQSGPGAQAHSNVHIFQHNGMPVTHTVRPLAGPPVSGYFYETPASIACIYNLVTPTPGCDPNNVSLVPTGGSRAIAIVDAYSAP